LLSKFGKYDFAINVLTETCYKRASIRSTKILRW